MAKECLLIAHQKPGQAFVCFLMRQHHPIPVLCAEGQGCSLFCQSAVTSSSQGSVPSTPWRSTQLCWCESQHMHTGIHISYCPDGERGMITFTVPAGTDREKRIEVHRQSNFLRPSSGPKRLFNRSDSMKTHQLLELFVQVDPLTRVRADFNGHHEGT